MPAAVEASGYLCHVNRLAGGAGHQLDVLFQFHQHEEGGWLEQIAQLVGQGGDLLDITLSDGGSDDHRLAVEFVDLAIVQKLIVELALFFRERVVEEFVDHFQAGSLFQEPGRAAHVPGGGAGIGKRACVLVDAEEEQCRFDGREGQVGFADLLNQ